MTKFFPLFEKLTAWKPGLTPSFDTVMSGNSSGLVSGGPVDYP